jgi:hypothetical protein
MLRLNPPRLIVRDEGRRQSETEALLCSRLPEVSEVSEYSCRIIGSVLILRKSHPRMKTTEFFSFKSVAGVGAAVRRRAGGLRTQQGFLAYHGNRWFWASRFKCSSPGMVSVERNCLDVRCGSGPAFRHPPQQTSGSRRQHENAERGGGLAQAEVAAAGGVWSGAGGY